jgi:hypothetical protein
MAKPTAGHPAGCGCNACVKRVYVTQSKPYTQQPGHPANTTGKKK